MKRTIAISAALLLVVVAGAALAPAQTGTGSAAASTPAAAATLSADELEALVAPIALYPDVLIAQILPAATFPTDVVMAARWLRTKPDLGKLKDKPWDESVKALCNYPDVLYKLDEDLDWTNALGAAFLAQEDDLMQAIQVGRARATTAGALQTNEQQTVVVEQETIRIVPTQAEVVYVPTYDPEIVYVDSGVSTGAVVAASAISFGAGFALGTWLDLDCNWHGHNVYYCQPGYWGGWAHSGAVAWGPRRVAVVGPERGFVAGPRGGAAWGPNGGAVWRRPPVAAPMPAYSGRYASYGNRYGGSYYGSRNVTNNINVNRNNVNVDRGDRTNIAGGSRTNVSGGDRTWPGAGQRPGGGTPQQLPANAYDRRGSAANAGTRPSTDASSVFDSSRRPQQTSQYSQRGQQSRDAVRSGAGSQQPFTPAPQARSGQPSSTPRSSAFNSGQSARQTSSYSGRGAASRGGGGGGRGGGGRR